MSALEASIERGRALHADFTKPVAKRSLAEWLSHLDLLAK